MYRCSEGAPRREYQLADGDFTAKYEDLLRFYFEYAIRREESLTVPGGRNIAYGYVAEGELWLSRCLPLDLLVRYDTLEHRPAFFVFPDNLIERLTWGINWTLAGGSLLMLNHEHWYDASPADDIDVVAVRWAAAF